LKEFGEQSEQANRIGSLILANLSILEEITSTILNARRNGYGWDEISKKIQEGQEKGIESAKAIQKLEPDRSLMLVELDGMIIELDFTQKVTTIAQEYFAYARKQKNKISGAQEAIEKTKKRLERAKQDFAEQVREQEIRESTIVERRKRDWYEKFRWFWSSDGMLVIAGRDARSNEALIRRYMKKGDLFVHATVHGAPHTVILAEGKEIPESTIQEAGQLAASFSSAWKAGIGATDVYYVDPEQVSFTPQSGEYLVRGGAIVRGKRNFLKGTVLETAVGVIIEEKYARAIGGPLKAIKSQTNTFVILKPGEETRGRIAKQIRIILASKVPEQEKRKVLLLDLNEFVQFIPGNSKILDDSN
jgi:predicted ribosome quality control (RQC) complex YloA/Tae2 family protein